MDELMDADEIIVSSSSYLWILAKCVDNICVDGKDNNLLTKIQDEVFNEFMRETE